MPDKQSYDDKSGRDQSKDAFETLEEISRILNTGLDSKSLCLCVRLCENGVHPEALAKVIKEIRHEVNLMNEQNKK